VKRHATEVNVALALLAAFRTLRAYGEQEKERQAAEAKRREDQKHINGMHHQLAMAVALLRARRDFEQQIASRLAPYFRALLLLRLETVGVRTAIQRRSSSGSGE
jgi:hypothetical protein